MKRTLPDGSTEFRPTIARASLPLAFSAVAVPLAGVVLAQFDLVPWWMAFTALSGSLLMFGASFLMPWLQTVRVEHGCIAGPSGYGINTLQLHRIDLRKSCIDAFGQATLVDDLGSTLVLSPTLLPAEEIAEAVVLFGLDPDTLARTHRVL